MKSNSFYFERRLLHCFAACRSCFCSTMSSVALGENGGEFVGEDSLIFKGRAIFVGAKIRWQGPFEQGYICLAGPISSTLHSRTGPVSARLHWRTWPMAPLVCLRRSFPDRFIIRAVDQFFTRCYEPLHKAATFWTFHLKLLCFCLGSVRIQHYNYFQFII